MCTIITCNCNSTVKVYIYSTKYVELYTCIMANAQVGVRFIENSRGSQTLVHNEYMFSLKTRRGDRSYWNCVNRDCTAKINTQNGIPTKIMVNHNHPQDPLGVTAKQLMSNVRKRVRETIEPIPAIYDDMLANLRTPEWDADTEAVAIKLPTFYSARPALYR